MKIVTKPKRHEEAVYYSDFSGKLIKEFRPPVTMTLSFSYGSIYDGGDLEFHLTDDDLEPVLEYIKSKLTADTKKQMKNSLEDINEQFDMALDSRDQGECTYLSSNISLIHRLIDGSSTAV